MTLRTPNEDEETFIGERSNHHSNVISATTARKMVWKGCEAYLAYVIDTVKARSSISDIPTISDFPDVFPEEFPRLPPQRKIELLSTLYQVPRRHPLHRIEWLRW